MSVRFIEIKLREFVPSSKSILTYCQSGILLFYKLTILWILLMSTLREEIFAEDIESYFIFQNKSLRTKKVASEKRS